MPMRLGFKISSAGRAFVLLSLFSPFISSSSPLDTSRIQEQPKYGGVLRIKDFSNRFIVNFDPASNVNFFILEQLYDGLVHLQKNFIPAPSLAEYWQISEDGRKYVFQLRKGVKFHNGSELTADDVKFSLERLVDPKTPGAFFQFFVNRVVGAQDFHEGKAAEISGFKVKDRYTFEMSLTNPYVSALQLLSMYFCKILPKDLVIEQGKRFFQKPVGTGPFKYANLLRSPNLNIIGVRLDRNPDYFGGPPYLEAVEYSPSYTLDDFLDKKIDIIPYYSERLSNYDCRVLENDSLDLFFLGMSCHIPPFNDKSVRKALSLAIDKRKVAEAAFTMESSAMALDNFTQMLPGFYPVLNLASSDPERAKRLLAEAGFDDHRKFPAVTLYVMRPKSGAMTNIYRELKNQLARVGIGLDVRFQTSEADLKTIKKPYLVLIEWLMDFPDPENVILPLFRSSAEVNRTYINYGQPQLDRLLEEAEIESSWTRRNGLFQQIEKILFDEVPAVPLLFNRQRIAYQPGVKGIGIPAMGFFFLDAKDIWLDRR